MEAYTDRGNTLFDTGPKFRGHLSRAGFVAITAAALTLAAGSVSAATDQAIQDRYCEALENNAFVVEPLSEAELGEIGVTPTNLSVAEINVMTDAAYTAWWNTVLNKAEVTEQYNAGEDVHSLVVSETGLDTFLASFYERIQQLCPEVGEKIIVQSSTVAAGGVDVGVFPEGVYPVISASGSEQLIGIPYTAAGDVDIAHDFWTVKSNLIAIGIPLKEGGSVDQAKLEADNLIHTAWVLAADLRWREARAKSAAESTAAVEVVRDLLGIARGERVTN